MTHHQKPRASDETLRTGRQARLRLRLTATAETIVRGGHPWVFAGSIREQNRPGTAGELAVIYDRNDKFLAVGLFDPESPLRVRVLHTGQPLTIGPGWWEAQLEAAVARRAGLFDEQTTGYRIINGESDGWPGMVLDRYGGTLVLKLYAAAWLPRLDEITSLIDHRLKPACLVLRLSRALMRGTLGPGIVDGKILLGDAFSGIPTFQESGLVFEVDVIRGQKTGFFLDQRENRRRVELLAPGRSVLNAFSFSGGFSLYAARGGAQSVTDLDISKHALESARRNFSLNWNNPMVARCAHASIQADAFAWLGENRERRFDLIVLDPPSLAKRETERAGAIRAYGKLVVDGIQRLGRNGVLVACSCSAHVNADEFYAAVRQAAKLSQRRFVELETTGHAPDHPATFTEARYLKAIYLRFDRN